MIYEPLVSIITPVLNGKKYLETCIRSVLEQSYSKIEHIFIDGGSTDGTLEILSRYSTKYTGRIKYVSKKDKGVGDAVNRGFKMAEGEVLSWFDSDDLYLKETVQTVVDFFRNNPDASFVFGGCDIINESGEIIGTRPVKDFDFKEAVTDRHYIFLPAVFYQREVINRAGVFNPLGNDLDFYLRAAKNFPLYRIDATLAQWRRHQDSITSSKAPKDRNTDRRRFREDYLLCRKYGGEMLAPRARRYAIFVLLDWLRLYPFINRAVLPKLRRHQFMNKVLKKMGA